MYKYMDYEGIPAVIIDTTKRFRAVKLVKSKWQPLSMADAGTKGFVIDEPNWRKQFKTVLKNAPSIPIK